MVSPVFEVDLFDAAVQSCGVKPCFSVGFGLTQNLVEGLADWPGGVGHLELFVVRGSGFQEGVAVLLDFGWLWV